jgi:hypothetical protein
MHILRVAHGAGRPCHLYLYLIGHAPYIEPERDLIRASFNRIRVLTSFFNSAGDNGLSGVKRIVPLLVGKFLSSSLCVSIGPAPGKKLQWFLKPAYETSIRLFSLKVGTP